MSVPSQSSRLRPLCGAVRRCALGGLAWFRGAPSPETAILSKDALAFARYRDERDGVCPRDFSGLEAGGTPGLVSIVLPVFNGERYLEEAIASIRAQTYGLWELIVVDDGSTDATPAILERWAAVEPRLRVHRQSNRKLPAALNAGHAMARGEFITWTSDDNRLRPQMLTTLVEELRQRPSVDLLYADYQVIDGEGGPLRHAEFCAALQDPPASGCIRLPSDPAVLLYHPGNFIGSAFLYRRRLWALIGGYDEQWFTCEDYDFFLRAIGQGSVAHCTSTAPLYEYRIHGGALSATVARDALAQGARACFVFDAWRREVARDRLAWRVEVPEHPSPAVRRALRDLQRCAAGRAEPWAVLDPDRPLSTATAPTVYCRLSEVPGAAAQPPGPAAEGCALRVLWTQTPPEEGPVDPHWDVLALADGPGPMPPAMSGRRNEWWRCADAATLWHVLHGLRSVAAARPPAPLEAPPGESVPGLSVVVCTQRPSMFLRRTLETLRTQASPAGGWELIVVDNAPAGRAAGELEALLAHWPAPARVVALAQPGLSRARNAGFAAARGEVVLYLDDDIEAAPGLLARIAESFAADPALGVLGGAVQLQRPAPAPRWFGPALAPFYSELLPDGIGLQPVEAWNQFPLGANWAARHCALQAIGGFSPRYGRGGLACDSAEEVVAALQIQRLGWTVAVGGDVRVLHCPDPGRFRLRAVWREARHAWRSRLTMEQDGYLPRQLAPLGLSVYGLRRLAAGLKPGLRPDERINHWVTAGGCFEAAGALLWQWTERIVRRPRP